MITYFKHKNNKYKKEYKKYKRFFTILKPFEEFVIIATTSISFTWSLTGFRLKVIPRSSSIQCGLTISN